MADEELNFQFNEEKLKTIRVKFDNSQIDIRESLPLIESNEKTKKQTRSDFAFVLAENRCLVTAFEADNPFQGAPEIFVDNLLCQANPESF